MHPSLAETTAWLVDIDSVTGDEVAHYIWIDFIPDPEKGNAYLDEVHKPTGTSRSF